MLAARPIVLLAGAEFRAALRNWWVVLYAVVFTALAAGVVTLSESELAGLERGEFGRTAAALTNVVLFVVPLFGLIAGALGIAAERERGLLAYYLAQPVTAAEVFWGRYVGALLALLGALATGFGVTALLLARSGSIDGLDIAWLFGLACLLLLASFSIGTLISALARGSAVALGVAVFVWVLLLFLGDLGLMATAVATRLDLRIVIFVALLNPTEAFKVAAIDEIGTSLDALGPAGNYLVQNLGAGLRPLLVGLLATWAIAPALLAQFFFGRSDA